MPVKDGLYNFIQLAKQVAETARSHRESDNKDKKTSKDEFLSGFWKEDRLFQSSRWSYIMVLINGMDRRV